VEEGAVIEDSILFFDSTVRSGAVVRHTIADTDCVISRHADVGDSGDALTVIGMETVVPEEVRVRGGVTIHPKLKAESFSKKEYLTGEVVQ